MSLARTLMNGGMVSGVTVNSARYGHADGASIIAMESVEELHDIFMESYNYEQADIAAMTEGVALEGSQYEAVAEAAIKNAITKIKEFFSKLWAKVKAFFHNVRRYLDAIFMSGKDFVKKYKKDIDKIDLKDFSYTMHTYKDDVIDNFYQEVDIEKAVDTITNTVIKAYSNVVSKIEAGTNMGDDKYDNVEQVIKTIKDCTEDDEAVTILTNGECKNIDDFDEFTKELFREDVDKEERDLSASHIKDFASTISESKAMKSMDKCQSQSDKTFSKIIKNTSDAEKAADKLKGERAAQLSKLFSSYSSYVSKLQSLTNRIINAWKTAVKERDSEYKSVIVAAISASDKKKREDKK